MWAPCVVGGTDVHSCGGLNASRWRSGPRCAYTPGVAAVGAQRSLAQAEDTGRGIRVCLSRSLAASLCLCAEGCAAMFPALICSFDVWLSIPPRRKYVVLSVIRSWLRGPLQVSGGGGAWPLYRPLCPLAECRSSAQPGGTNPLGDTQKGGPASAALLCWRHQEVCSQKHKPCFFIFSCI